jgi:predicted TIM-barrel fold metal-dependent hydrolase
MIVDAHTHVWPDAIAARALAGNRVPGLEAYGDGTVAGLRTDMTGSGVDVSCCFAIANEPRHVESVNAFAAGLRTDRLFPVGSVHLGLSTEENLRTLDCNGITRVKIHPLFQGFGLDDARLWELFEAFGDRISVITHVGAGGDAHSNSLSSPAMIVEIAERFPLLRLTACHFGGYKMFDLAEETLSGLDVTLETSWPPSLSQLRPERVARFIRTHGAENVVFGSDWPMADPATEIAVIRSLGLSDRETELVLGHNLAAILGVPLG